MFLLDRVDIKTDVTHKNMHTKNNLLGIAFMLAYTVFISITEIFFRLQAEHFSRGQIIFLLNAFALVFLLPKVVVHKHYKTSLKHIPIYFVMGFIIFCGHLALIHAYANMIFANVTAITLTYPLFGTLFAVVFLKERIGILRIIALIIGFVGALIIVNPISTHFSIYALATLYAAIAWGLFDIILKVVGRRDGPITQLFYTLFCTVFFASAPALLDWHTLSLKDIGLFILFGGVMFGEMGCAMAAVNYADVSIVTPFYFCTMIFAFIISYVFFNEPIRNNVVIGIILIIASSLFIIYRERIAKKRAAKKRAVLL